MKKNNITAVCEKGDTLWHQAAEIKPMYGPRLGNLKAITFSAPRGS